MFRYVEREPRDSEIQPQFTCFPGTNVLALLVQKYYKIVARRRYVERQPRDSEIRPAVMRPRHLTPTRAVVKQ